MNLVLEEKEEGVLLLVQVTAKARNNAITGIHQGRLKVSITQAPEKGKANKALIQLLAKELKIRKPQISLFTGQTSPLKKLLITNMEPSELDNRITELLKIRG